MISLGCEQRLLFLNPAGVSPLVHADRLQPLLEFPIRSTRMQPAHVASLPLFWGRRDPLVFEAVSVISKIRIPAEGHILGVIVPLGGTGILMSSGEGGTKSSSIPGIDILVASLL